VENSRGLGNIGSFLGGVSAVLLAAAAIIGGSAGLGDWRAKQREQRALASMFRDLDLSG
jgi:hypothetical protein